MDGIQDVMELILQGALLVLALFAILWVMVVMVNIQRWLEKRLAVADRALAPFGNTPVGKAVNQFLTGYVAKVDEADDPLVQALMAWPVLAQMKDAGVISADQVSQMLTTSLKTVIDLTDGVAGQPDMPPGEPPPEGEPDKPPPEGQPENPT